MLTTTDLLKEIEMMEDVYNNETDPYKKAMLKASILNLKLQQNIRANTVLVMNHFKIDKVKKTRPEGLFARTEEK